jgi:hypothetical protein
MKKNVVYKMVSAKNLAGWVDGWAAGKAGLRIAYSNQKSCTSTEFSFKQNDTQN